MVERASRWQPLDEAKLSTAVAKWVATDWRLLNLVGGLREVLLLATADPSYTLPTRGRTGKRV